jgi:hypothetical protein
MRSLQGVNKHVELRFSKHLCGIYSIAALANQRQSMIILQKLLDHDRHEHDLIRRIKYSRDV